MAHNVTEYATMKDGLIEYYGSPPLFADDGRMFVDASPPNPGWFDGLGVALLECWHSLTIEWARIRGWLDGPR